MKEKLLLLAAAIIFVGSIIFQNIYWTAVALGIGLYLQPKNIFRESEESHKERFVKRKGNQ